MQCSLLSLVILQAEVKDNLNAMSSGKAVGINGISIGALQALRDFGVEMLTEKCDTTNRKVLILEDFTTSYL